MEDNWDENIEEVTTSMSNISTGFPVGRGRGVPRSQPQQQQNKPGEWTVAPPPPRSTCSPARPGFSSSYNNQGGDGWNSGNQNGSNQNEDGWEESQDSWNPNSEFSSSPPSYNRGPRGGGGGGRSQTCYNCQQEGHIGRDCPNKGSGGGGRERGPMTCYNCQQEGHIGRDCPNKGSGRERKPLSCFKCSQEGHMSRDCPESGSTGGGRGGGGMCYNCNEQGHISRDCPNPRSTGGGRRRCNNCNEEGHISRDCTNSSSSMGGGRGGGGGGGNMTCYKCNGQGHVSRDCPNSDGGMGGGMQRGSERPFRGSHREGGNEPTEQKPREIYKPVEINDEASLFREGIDVGINFDKQDKANVECSGDNKPKPILSFQEAGLCSTLMTNISKSNYTKPTPIQKYSIPIVMNGRDMMACAQTGSGKTAAFLLPILQNLITDPDLPNMSGERVQKPQVLVVTPTRELAIQINQECRKFALYSSVQTQVIYGGTSIQYQASLIQRNGIHVLVATPGRLVDFIRSDRVSLSCIRFLVFDEADRMLDMGFQKEIEQVLNSFDLVPKDRRQTLMFSATFPKDIQKMAAQYLNPNYIFLNIGIVGAANTDVSQNFHEVSQYNKRSKLIEILREEDPETKTLVFVELKRTADFLASFLSQTQFKSTSIHGDRLQREREMALNDFKRGDMKVLVATGVASRGLDIKNVGHVINYDLPKNIEEYVHRIGRTGRVGHLGKATSFYDSNQDNPLAADLVKILSDAEQEVPSWLAEAAQGQTSFGGNFGGRDYRSRGRNDYGNNNNFGGSHDGGSNMSGWEEPQQPSAGGGGGYEESWDD